MAYVKRIGNRYKSFKGTWEQCWKWIDDNIREKAKWAYMVYKELG